MKNNKKITIIGSGFSAASAYLAQSGYDVTVFEKTMLLVVVLDN
jgi:phytoene desaturase